jgi:predicted Zn finger-like uncharacterized protein
MKITCGSCGAKYTVSDDKVQGKTVKVKCRKCSAVIVVSSTGEVQTSGGNGHSTGALAAEAATFTVSVGDNDQRNMTMAEIVAAYNEGVIDAETYCWSEGMDDWTPLKDVDAIVDALHDAAASADMTEQPQDLSSTVAMTDASSSAAGYGASYGSSPPQAAYAAAPKAAAAYAAPAPSPAYPQPRPAAEVYGSTVAMASSPFDMPSTGSGGGLFSAPSASPGGGGEENSAIFSLNMLTAKVNQPASTRSGSGGTTEDSGLIDLKALAAGMGGDSGGVAAMTAVAAAPVADGVFPLGAPPTVPMTAPSLPAPAPTSNRGMIIGLGAAVMVLAAALIFFIVKDSGPPPTSKDGQGESGNNSNSNNNASKPPDPAQPAPPTQPVAGTDTSAAAPTPETPSSAEPDSSGKVAANPTPGARPGPVPQTGPRPPTPTPGPGPAPGPKPGGGTGACGCKADDLMCNMRCSQKKKKK